MKIIDKQAIILNKPFIGSWNSISGNVPHEIIDFLLTDENEYYVYNVPWGVCPKWIQVGKPISKKETHKVKYLLLTSSWKQITSKPHVNGQVNLLYCIELEQKLHDYSRSKNKKNLKGIQKKVQDIIDRKNIKYHSKKLYDIWGTKDETLYVTFQAKTIFKAKQEINVELEYKYQRNKGYIKSEEYCDDYTKLINQINDKSLWEELELSNVQRNFKDFEKLVKSQNCSKLQKVADEFIKLL